MSIGLAVRQGSRWAALVGSSVFGVLACVPWAAATPILAVQFSDTGNGASLQGVPGSGAAQGATFNDFNGSSGESSAPAMTFGSYTVNISGQTGFFVRPGFVTNNPPFDEANLYNTFAYVNTNAASGTNSLSFSVAGLANSTAYSVTLYDFDASGLDGVHTVAYSGLSGTLGAASSGYTAGTQPTADDAFSGTGTFTTNSSGTLTIQVTDTFSGSTDAGSGVRLNGFVINAIGVPEPAACTLLALGGLGLFIAARRRRG